MKFNNKLVDWFYDNGISLGMIGDIHRNQFYDNILKSVAGLRCVDIGFGTGLLSFLAIKHGAEHVTAFESNTERYLLGLHLIEKLKLQDKITLVNAQFTADKLTNQEIIFQEIFDQEFWADGLAYCAINHTLPMLPNRYMCEFYLTPISDDLCNQLITTRPNLSSVFLSDAVNDALKEQTNNWKIFYNQVKGSDWPVNAPEHIDQLEPWIQEEIKKFNHKQSAADHNTVDIGVLFSKSEDYLTEINKLVNLQKTSCIHRLLNINESLLTRQQYLQLINNGIKIAEYEFDYISNTITTNDYRGKLINILDRSQMYIDLLLDKTLFADQNYILLPITTVGHGDYELVLPPVTDEINIHKYNGVRYYASSAWTLPIHNLIFVRPNFINSQQLCARQYLDSGILRIYDDN